MLGTCGPGSRGPYLRSLCTVVCSRRFLLLCVGLGIGGRGIQWGAFRRIWHILSHLWGLSSSVMWRHGLACGTESIVPGVVCPAISLFGLVFQRVLVVL